MIFGVGVDVLNFFLYRFDVILFWWVLVGNVWYK